MHSNLRALCARKHCKASAPRREVPAGTGALRCVVPVGTGALRRVLPVG